MNEINKNFKCRFRVAFHSLDIPDTVVNSSKLDSPSIGNIANNPYMYNIGLK